MTDEAPLQRWPTGSVPAGDGWFVVNVRDAAWLEHPAYGFACLFENPRGTQFPELGVRIRVLLPGQPLGLYHAEEAQEGFLVLAGECVLVVEGEERRLRQWDYVHCPAGTAHAMVGTGDGPCAILMIGARRPDATIDYPVSEAAARHGLSVPERSDNARDAYERAGWTRGSTPVPMPWPD